MAAMAIACFLASRGAPLHVRNRTGKTPLDLITNPSWKAKVLFYAQLAEDTSEHPAAAAVEASPSSSGAVEGAAAAQVAAADGAAVVEDASEASASAAAMAPSSAPVLAALADGTECVVCCEPSSRVGALVRFLPCAHVIACADCSVRMKKCLKCGQIISAKVGAGEYVSSLECFLLNFQ
jgi:hypothetical protein